MPSSLSVNQIHKPLERFTEFQKWLYVHHDDNQQTYFFEEESFWGSQTYIWSSYDGEQIIENYKLTNLIFRIKISWWRFPVNKVYKKAKCGGEENQHDSKVVGQKSG